MDKVQIIPPPKGVDPRVLVWKGAAVLGKMDGVSDLWVTASDWVSFRSYTRYSVHWRLPAFQDLLGIRGLRERCFYL
jgi:actin-related protein 8